ncbi:hypothetical protein BaRGS_00004571, partial [Batillaria attramentaria]
AHGSGPFYGSDQMLKRAHLYDLPITARNYHLDLQVQQAYKVTDEFVTVTKHGPHKCLYPADDGPFGSILWRDKKYLVSVLIPVGVGFTGAIMIIVMAYVSRAWRKRKERARAQGSPRSFLE